MLIRECFEEGKQVYGYRRLKKALLIKYGWIINHKKILRIMKKYNIKVRYKRIYKRKFIRRAIIENTKPNLLKRNFNAHSPNQKWVTDITYLIINGKRAYLSTILDLYDRKIVSYKISYKNDNKLVIDTLNDALRKRKDVHGVILHSDQGYQYTSYEYKELCSSNNIRASMSPKGSPVDNSPIESFHSSLKRETLYSYNIKNLEELIVLVKDWLKFYNTTRLNLIV